MLQLVRSLDSVIIGGGIALTVVLAFIALAGGWVWNEKRRAGRAENRVYHWWQVAIDILPLAALGLCVWAVLGGANVISWTLPGIVVVLLIWIRFSTQWN